MKHWAEQRLKENGGDCAKRLVIWYPAINPYYTSPSVALKEFRFFTEEYSPLSQSEEMDAWITADEIPF